MNTLERHELIPLIAENSIKEVSFIACDGGFYLKINTTSRTYKLHTQRNSLRVFKSLDAGVSFLKQLSIMDFKVHLAGCKKD